MLLTVWLICSLAACRPQEEPPPSQPPLITPEKQAEMQEIRLIEVQDGDKKWELVAKGADYVKDTNQIRIFDIWVELYGRGGDNLILTAAQGTINYQSRQLVLSGPVQARAKNYEFTATEILYDPAKRLLQAPGPVQIRGERLQVSGRDLTLDLKHQKLVLAHHDRTEFRLGRTLW